MKVYTFKEFKRKPGKILKTIEADQECAVIARSGQRSVVIVPWAEYARAMGIRTHKNAAVDE